LETRQAVEHWKASGLDLSKLLAMPPRPEGSELYCCESQDHGLELALDHKLIEQSQPAIQHGQPVQISLPIRNANRTVGTMLSGVISKKYGEDGLPPGTVSIHFNGSAGQSFCAFLAQGIDIKLDGDTNDYMAKGMAGGRIVICPPSGADFVPEDNIIIGNVALYGATGGQVFIRGRAGERFCVRNSGVRAVVEGVGDHGCEYMTSGVVVVLGSTGRNFAAGMSGGVAFVYDQDDDFEIRFNPGLADLELVTEPHDIATLRSMIEQHWNLTGSGPAERILNNWDGALTKFKKIMPRDYRRVLEQLKLDQGQQLEVARHG